MASMARRVIGDGFVGFSLGANSSARWMRDGQPGLSSMTRLEIDEGRVEVVLLGGQVRRNCEWRSRALRVMFNGALKFREGDAGLIGFNRRLHRGGYAPAASFQGERGQLITWNSGYDRSVSHHWEDLITTGSS